MHKLGLALGSGGARGVAHVGFLQALDENGIKPDFIAGCSMGAVVGGVYASGMPASEIRDIVIKLRARDIIDISAWPLSKMALLRSKKVRDIFVEHVGGKNLQDFPIPFKCVATDLYSGNLHIFEKGDAVTAIQASSTIPGIFRPVKLDDELLVDGGCLCRVPIKIVKDMGADVVVAVDVLKNCSQPIDDVHNILTMMLRVFDVMDAHNTAMLRERDKDICDLYIEPEMKGMSQYLIKDLDRAYMEGYTAGIGNINKIKELLG